MFFRYRARRGKSATQFVDKQELDDSSIITESPVCATPEVAVITGPGER